MQVLQNMALCLWVKLNHLFDQRASLGECIWDPPPAGKSGHSRVYIGAVPQSGQIYPAYLPEGIVQASDVRSRVEVERESKSVDTYLILLIMADEPQRGEYRAYFMY